MDLKRFWDLLASCRQPDDAAYRQALIAELAKLFPEDIAAFHIRVWHLIGVANRWELWGAAYLIQGGCSDDGFCYFRAWLIAQGKEVFEKVLADPDSLAEASRPENGYYEFEDLLGVAGDAWQEAGHGLDEDLHDRVSAVNCEPYPSTQGERWDFRDDAEMRRRYPRIREKIGS
jgi:hypothetical protein